MIKHIVFDFGGVILDLDGVHTGYPDDLAKIFGISIQEAVELWNTNKTSVMTGKESPKQFLERIKTEYNFIFDLQAGLEFWERRNYITKVRIDWQLVQMLEQLKTNYRLHMLTDQIQLNNSAVDWKNEFETHFHTILRSYEEGFRKPDAAAFQNLLSRINAGTNEVIFIDDALINCQAAEAIGIAALQYKYKDHQQLLQFFEKFGVRLI